MSLRSPLGEAKGLGSAKEGLHHWWAQRVTAVALIPLTIWFAFKVAVLSQSDYQTVLACIGSPWSAALIVSLIVAAFYHAALGMQVIFEDYIGHKAARVGAIMATNLLLFLLGAAAIIAVVRIALGG
ncbi:succinate dehydrogenase, hydrophobic membrane anchor protein [Cycloclasticus sp. 46_83_sub15_T18]|nr:succinate dehydrogenase, hydrophobic membrane anchor protein [Cycloclasticus sp. 46_83_sub15_T18]